MSTTPRSPLLRDKSIESMARNSSDAIVSATIMDPAFDDRASEAFRTGEDVGRNVRRFYENLITDGKLRVVEEVESVPTIQGVTMSAKCSGCGLKPLMFNFAYCPGCGNKIKRTKQ